MKMTKRTGWKVGLVSFVLMTISAPAFAATGTYAFSANFKYRLNSGSWKQVAGVPKWSFTCTSEKGQVYSVTLYKNRLLSDENKGSLTFTCDSKVDSGSWPSVDSGDYHFTLTKSDNGVFVVGSGSVSYPK